MDNNQDNVQDSGKHACPGCGLPAEVYVDGNHRLYFCRTCEPNSPITLKARIAELEIQVENAIELLLRQNEGQLTRDEVMDMLSSPLKG